MGGGEKATGGGEKGERRSYPIRAEDYELYEVVGQGVSASVFRARCKPLDEVIAIKVLDFERNNSDLNNIMREAQTMILIDHPNVLKALCSFVNDHTLWVVMPYMAGGSSLHIMKSVYPNGFEEVIIASVLREVLKGLEYLHRHGHIHRDVKAGNILVDSRGGIKLGDFGVSACLFDSGDRQRSRNTFVGTPCWMAPEVMEQLHGYDCKADIWSFGITALELAHGHAPFSKYPPMKVLLMTLQNAPPGLDYERDKKFSRQFKQMIAVCLVKDPSKRPTATKLLKQPFFKQARSHEFIARKILEGLPTLGARYQALKEKDEDLLAQKKMPDGKKEEISQNEYKRGISSWNFDLDDLKARASLIPDGDDSTSGKDSDTSSLFDIDHMQERVAEGPSFSRGCSIKYDADTENDVMPNSKSTPVSSPEQSTCLSRNASMRVTTNGVPLNGNVRKHDSVESCELEIQDRGSEGAPINSSHERRFSTGSCSSDGLPSSRESFVQHSHMHNPDKCNGGPLLALDETSSEAIPRGTKSAVSNVEDPDDRSKPPIIQRRGRFKVTSGNVELDKAHPSIGLQKCHSMQAISQLPSIIPSSAEAASNILGGSSYIQLYSILQTNLVQREQLLTMMKQLTAGDMPSPISVASTSRSTDAISPPGPPSPAFPAERSLLEASHEREKELMHEITDLQWRLLCAQDEIQRLKARTAQI